MQTSSVSELLPASHIQTFADVIFKHIILNENIGSLIKISLKFPTDKSALV